MAPQDLSTKKLLSFFKSRSTDLRNLEADCLENPTCETVSRLYTYAVCKATGVREDALQELHSGTMIKICMAYPELQTASVAKLNLILSVDFILNSIQRKTDDNTVVFNLNDIILPTKKRTIYLLNKIVNYLLHVETVSSVSARPMLNTMEDERQQMGHLSQEIGRLRTQIAACERDAEDRAEFARDIRKENEQLSAELSNKQTETEKAEAASTKLGNQLEKDAKDMTRMKAELERLEHEDCRLAYQLVSSPEKLAGSVDKLKEEKLHVERKLKANSEKLTHQDARLHVELPKIVAQIGTLRDLLSILTQANEKGRVIQAEIDALENNMPQVDARKRGLQHDLKLKAQQLERAQEKLRKLDAFQAQRMQDLNKELKKSETELEALRSEKSDQDAVSKDMSSRCGKLIDELTEMKRRRDELLGKIDNTASQLVKKFQRTRDSKTAELHTMTHEVDMFTGELAKEEQWFKQELKDDEQALKSYPHN